MNPRETTVVLVNDQIIFHARSDNRRDQQRNRAFFLVPKITEASCCSEVGRVPILDLTADDLFNFLFSWKGEFDPPISARNVRET